LLAGWPEFRGLRILSIFPGLVVQQIQNTPAVRHLQPRGPDSFELVVTYFGYADDGDAQTAVGVKQSNLIGPAGFVSMEDGHATEIVQQALHGDCAGTSVLVMGGRDTADQDNLVNEAAIRGLWLYWRGLISAPETQHG
jgi:anthranilate 1,2-dioxygenase large subunit